LPQFPTSTLLLASSLQAPVVSPPLKRAAVRTKNIDRQPTEKNLSEADTPPSFKPKARSSQYAELCKKINMWRGQLEGGAARERGSQPRHERVSARVTASKRQIGRCVYIYAASNMTTAQPLKTQTSRTTLDRDLGEYSKSRETAKTAS